VAAGIAITGNTGVDTLRNTGTVVGDVLLGDGTDSVTNDGVIRGTIGLGVGNDAYTGILGRATGAVLGGAGLDSLTGGAAADSLDGGTSNDVLTGGAGNDTLIGGTGNDTINGGSGNDSLTAGNGTDLLTGGSGADDFIFASSANIGLATARDQITDFAHGSDDLVMTFMGSFIGSAGFTAAGQVRYNAATGLLSGSTDGDVAAEWTLLLVNKPVITAGDFVF
jgi:Ca2+-binding RTX toxin-like protein